MPPRRSFLLRQVKNIVPDEALLQRYLRHWHSGDLYHNSSSFPKLTSIEFFDSSEPLHIEIGCGTGEFLCSQAEAQQNRNFIGIDTSLKSLYAAVLLAAQLNLTNIKFVRASAQYVYSLLVDESVEAFYVLFPEPILHPKFRKRRIFNPPFLREITRALLPAGRLTLVTDSEELFGTFLEQVERQTILQRIHEDRFLLGFSPTVKTRYQQYWEGLGAKIYRLELRKHV